MKFLAAILLLAILVTMATAHALDTRNDHHDHGCDVKYLDVFVHKSGKDYPCAVRYVWNDEHPEQPTYQCGVTAECVGPNRISVCRDPGFGNPFCRTVQSDCDYLVLDFGEGTSTVTTCFKEHENDFKWELLPEYLRNRGQQNH